MILTLALTLVNLTPTRVGYPGMVCVPVQQASGVRGDGASGLVLTDLKGGGVCMCVCVCVWRGGGVPSCLSRMLCGAAV